MEKELYLCLRSFNNYQTGQGFTKGLVYFGITDREGLKLINNEENDHYVTKYIHRFQKIEDKTITKTKVI